MVLELLTGFRLWLTVHVLRLTSTILCVLLLFLLLNDGAFLPLPCESEVCCQMKTSAVPNRGLANAASKIKSVKETKLTSFLRIKTLFLGRVKGHGVF